MADAALSADSRMVVPYITPWTGEREPDFKVIERRSGGIGYERENVPDRVELGVLWSRLTSAPGRGRPACGDMHPIRRRRAMARFFRELAREAGKLAAAVDPTGDAEIAGIGGIEAANGLEEDA